MDALLVMLVVLLSVAGGGSAAALILDGLFRIVSRLDQTGPLTIVKLR